MLYIVGTPIGNVEDMSLRGAKTLANSEVILAEDTRSFHMFYRRVLEMYGLKAVEGQKVVPYHDQNEFLQLPYVLKILEQGLEVSLVSEAGMPIVSDPGSLLLEHVNKNGLEYTVIPGPTAFVNGLLLSGIVKLPYVFLGFLSKKEKQVADILRPYFKGAGNSKDGGGSIVFYESPERVGETMRIISEIAPDIEVAICREMTKKFEEVIKGSAKELIDVKVKGEVVVVVRV